MNRTIVLLAMGLLGSGCVTHDTCDVRTVSVRWSTFHGADGADLNCHDAGVTHVAVWVDGGNAPVAEVPCTDFGVDIDAFAGPHAWTVEGESITGSGSGQTTTIVNRDSFRTDGDACGTLVEPVQPAAGFVELNYRFTHNGVPLSDQACAGDWIWTSIVDEVANRSAVLVDRNSFPETYRCGDPYPLVLPLPIGDYTFHWMEEHGAAASYDLLSADCGAQSFTVAPGDGSNGTPLTIDLETSPAGACGP